MWEAIVSAFRDGNGWLIILMLVLLGVCAKLGLVKIKTDKISVGRDASLAERNLMKKQVEYAYQACKAFEQRIPKFDGYNTYLGKYITEVTFDEIVNWIMFNHIEDTADYIKIKQDIIWNIIKCNSTITILIILIIQHCFRFIWRIIEFIQI